MDPITAGTLCLVVMMAVIAVGVPVSIAMAAVSAVGMWIFGGPAFMLSNFETLPYSMSSQFAFVAIPMFVLMGMLTSSAGLTTEIYNAAHRWTGGMRGSLYYATTLASAGFAAINGSTVVNALVFTRIALPEMLRFGYDRGLSAGCICAAGTFSGLIPPSIMMLVYGIITGELVGRLLMAGILPGLLTVVVYVIGLNIYLRYQPQYAPVATRRFSIAEKLESLRRLAPVLALVMIVLGGIYTGLMFPSAAGAAGAAGALAIGLCRGKLPLTEIWAAAKSTASTAAVIFLIIIAGVLFGRLLLISGFISELTDLMTSKGVGPKTFIAVVIVLYLVLGIFIDSISIMVVTVPILYPLAKSFDIDPIWLAVLVCKLTEIAVISPPVGINLFGVLMAADGKVTSRELFRGVMPFLYFEAVTLALILAFPEISLWLPRTMIQ